MIVVERERAREAGEWWWLVVGGGGGEEEKSERAEEWRQESSDEQAREGGRRKREAMVEHTVAHLGQGNRQAVKGSPGQSWSCSQP